MNTSYLTVSEYTRVSSGIDVNHLDFIDTTPGAQNAELANVISRASGWIENYCGISAGFYSTSILETRPIHLSRDGFLRVAPLNIPLVSVSSFQWRLYPTASWTVVDVNNIQVYPRFFETMFWYPFIGGQMTIQGSFAFPVTAPTSLYVGPNTAANLQDMQITAQYTYSQGYPNTTLTVASTLGATTLNVEDSTGMVVGSALTIYDGGSTENVTVLSVTNLTTIVVTKPTLFAHGRGCGVSSIPQDIKQACILVTNYLLKEKGVNSITMNGINNPEMQRYDQQSDLKIAKEFLKQYRRVI